MVGHLLDPLRDPTQPSVLFCGAGLSAGAVPMAQRRQRACESGGIPVKVGPFGQLMDISAHSPYLMRKR